MATKKQPYACAHCGQPCGVTGHLRAIRADLFGSAEAACRSVGAVPVTTEGEVRYGYFCPPDHTCLTASPLAMAFGRTTMAAPIARRNWRDDKPTPRQLEYLDALGYRGPRPMAKGQAHDLLELILKNKGTPPAQLEELRARGILIRD